MDLQTLIKTTLEGDDEPDIGMQAIGLPAQRAVFPADTVDSPSTKPFVIVRWVDTGVRMGGAVKRPAVLWFYDEEGDYTRAKKLRARATTLLLALPPQQLDTGFFAQFDEGADGGDLADPGWQALVAPKNLTAVGSAW